MPSLAKWLSVRLRTNWLESRCCHENVKLTGLKKNIYFVCRRTWLWYRTFFSSRKNEELNYISFGGRTSSDTETRNVVLDKELLAVYYVVRKCCVCLYSLYQNDFILHTDHKPQTYNYMLKDIVNKCCRCQFLGECSAKLIYVKGESNIIADFISRHVKEIKPLSVHSILHDKSDILSEKRNDADILRLFNFLQG